MDEHKAKNHQPRHTCSQPQDAAGENQRRWPKRVPAHDCVDCGRGKGPNGQLRVPQIAEKRGLGGRSLGDRVPFGTDYLLLGHQFFHIQPVAGEQWTKKIIR